MSLELIVHWLESWGQLDIKAVATLAAVFIATAFVPIPRTLLVVAAGVAFGLKSLIVIVPSTTLGGILVFLLSRGLLKTWVERQIDKRPALRVTARAVNDEGWRIVALMRFWGPVPNAVQNYLFGLTDIGFVPYALITLLFSLPQTIMYNYLGAIGRTMLLDDASSPFSVALMGLAGFTIITIVCLVGRRIRMILGQRPGLRRTTT